jgi:alanine racemase
MHKFIVETENLLHNLEIIRQRAENARIIGVLKGNGYGLGDCEVAKILVANGIDILAVSRLDEAISLRENGIDCEILVLSSTCITSEASVIIRYNLTATIGSAEAAVLLSGLAKQYGVTVKAHIKVDTGFGRFGFLHFEKEKICECFKLNENIEYTGIYSHFTDSFGKDESNTTVQYNRFCEVLEYINKMGISYGLAHISNSCALLRFPQYNLDAVRVGSALTGRIILKNKHGLRRVGFLRSQICDIKWLPAGYNIGYGNVYKTTKPCKIAVLTLGTADGVGLTKENYLLGFIHKLRNIFNILRQNKESTLKCLINGKTCTVVGRIGYTSLTVDVTEVDCVVGDYCDFNINPMYLSERIEREYI